MFTPEEIQARIRVQPFVPIRFVTSAGQMFEVYHPDLVLVGRRDVAIGHSSTENPAHYDQLSRLAIMHITAIEDLPVAKSPTGNGQS